MRRKPLFWTFSASLLALLAVPSWLVLDNMKAFLSTPSPDLGPLPPGTELRRTAPAQKRPKNAALRPAPAVTDRLRPVFVKFSILAPQAREVTVAGDFNMWRGDQFGLQRDRKGRWSTEVPIPPGRHRYRFRVDGAWVTDPSNPEKEKEPDGDSSVRMVP